MKHTITDYKVQAFNLDLYFSHAIQSHGHWNILCAVNYKNATQVFKYHFTDSEFVDTISEFKYNGRSFDDIQHKYFETFFDKFQEIILDILEWCDTIDA